MASEKTVTYKLEFDTQQLDTELIKLNKEMDELTQTQKELRKSNQAGSKEFAENAQELKKVKGSYSDVSKAITNVNKVRSKETGHLKKQKAQLSLVTRQIDKLTKEELDNEKIGGKLIKKQKQLSDSLSKVEKEGGNAHRSVGKYSEALDGMGSNLTSITGKGGKAGEMMGKFSAGAGIAVGAVAALVVGMYKYAEAALVAARDTTKVAWALGESRTQSNELRKEINVLNAVWGAEFNDTLKASQTLMYEFGVSSEFSLDIIKQGFESGADVNGQFLELLKEYPAQLASVGLSAKESIALLTQTEQMGIYSDKGIDAIKEGGIRLRENTKATADALKVLTKQTQEEVKNAIAKGKTFEAMKLISKELKNTTLSASETQTIIADVFGGAGEDAGIKFLSSLGEINLELDTLPNKLSEGETASNELTEAWSMFTDNLVSQDSGLVSFAAGVKNLFADIAWFFNEMIDRYEEWKGLTPDEKVAELAEDFKSTTSWIERTTKAVNEHMFSLETLNTRQSSIITQIERLNAKKERQTYLLSSEKKELKEYEDLLVVIADGITNYADEEKKLNKIKEEGIGLTDEQIAANKKAKQAADDAAAKKANAEAEKQRLIDLAAFKKTQAREDIDLVRKTRAERQAVLDNIYAKEKEDLKLLAEDSESTAVRQALNALSLVGDEKEKELALNKLYNRLSEEAAGQYYTSLNKAILKHGENTKDGLKYIKALQDINLANLKANLSNDLANQKVATSSVLKDNDYKHESLEISDSAYYKKKNEIAINSSNLEKKTQEKFVTDYVVLLQEKKALEIGIAIATIDAGQKLNDERAKIDIKYYNLTVKAGRDKVIAEEGINQAILESRRNLAKVSEMVYDERLQKELSLLEVQLQTQNDFLKENAQKEKDILENKFQQDIIAFKKTNEWVTMTTEEQNAYLVELALAHSMTIDEIEQELSEKRMSRVQQYADKVSDIMSGVADLQSALQNRETIALEKGLTARYKDEKAYNQAIVDDANSTTEEKAAARLELDAIEDAIDDKRNQALSDQFESAKSLKIAMVWMNAAQAILGTWAGYAEMGPYGSIAAGIQTALILSVASVQSDNIASQDYEQMAEGGMLKGNLHRNGGIKLANGTEVEGEEYAIINRASTQAYRPLLDYINQAGNGNGNVADVNPLINYDDMAAALTKAQSDQMVYVVSSDISDTLDNDKKLQVRSGF